MSNISDKKYSPEEIPSKVEVTITIYYTIAGYAQGIIGAYGFDWDGDKDNIVLCKHKVKLPIKPEKDIRELAVESLQESIKSIQAKAFMEITEIEKRIEQLLYIEYKGDNDD